MSLLSKVSGTDKLMEMFAKNMTQFISPVIAETRNELLRLVTGAMPERYPIVLREFLDQPDLDDATAQRIWEATLAFVGGINEATK